jgi:putative transposase
MTKDTMKNAAVAAESSLFDDWFDAIEDGIRARVCGFIETMLEEELSGTLSRPRYERANQMRMANRRWSSGLAQPPQARADRDFGRREISVARARLTGAGGKTSEWKSASLRAYQRRTRAADALIAGAYLSGTNTRRITPRIRHARWPIAYGI